MECSAELEPFLKNGLKLLRRTKDSNSVKQMWKHFEDAIQEQYGGGRRPTNAAKKMSVPTALLSKDLGIEQVDIPDDESSSSSSSSVVPLTATTSKSIVEVCSSPPPTITLEQAKSDPVINIDSDSDMEITDLGPADSLYSCRACKTNHVELGNSLVECLECHFMYHQNCHNPPIKNLNLDDPRIAWYCAECREKDSQKADSRASSGKESKKSASKSSSGTKAEKSSGGKTSQSSKTSSKSKSSSANSSPKHYPPTSSTISAMEKRVQMMKKKAAKKTEKKK